MYKENIYWSVSWDFCCATAGFPTPKHTDWNSLSPEEVKHQQLKDNTIYIAVCGSQSSSLSRICQESP